MSDYCKPARPSKKVEFDYAISKSDRDHRGFISDDNDSL